MITKDRLAKKRETIELLLAKAERSNHAAEAELAMAQAEKMMIQYGFERAQFNGDNRQHKQMVEHRYLIRGSYREGKARGFASIASAYQSVEVLRANGDNVIVLFIIGEEGDVADIVRVLDSIGIQMEHATKEWWAAHPGRELAGRQRGFHARREFMIYFGVGAADRVREMVHQEVQDEETAGTEVVLANRLNDAQRQAAAMYPNVKTNRSVIKSGGLGASTAGFVYGREASFGKAVQR